MKKPKLPRKRKKAAINVQGRKWYYDTIKLYKISRGIFHEPVCKFWVNSGVETKPNLSKEGQLTMIPVPKSFW